MVLLEAQLHCIMKEQQVSEIKVLPIRQFQDFPALIVKLIYSVYLCTSLYTRTMSTESGNNVIIIKVYRVVILTYLPADKGELPKDHTGWKLYITVTRKGDPFQFSIVHSTQSNLGQIPRNSGHLAWDGSPMKRGHLYLGVDSHEKRTLSWGQKGHSAEDGSPDQAYCWSHDF